MTTRDVGIRVAVTSDTKGAEAILAAFERIAPVLEQAMAKASEAGKKAETSIAAASEAVKKKEASLKGLASTLDTVVSKIPGGEVLGKPFSQGASLIEGMGKQVEGLVSKVPGLSGLGNSFAGLPALINPATLAVGALAAGVVGLAAVSLKLGGESSAAFATLAQKTGLAGEKLQGLEASFRHLAGTSGASMGEVSAAIAQVSARTGQTGPALEGLTKQLMQLSKVTGSDLTANINGVTRLFGDWGISTDKQGAQLDKLFKASQLTGVGVDELSRLTVQFGAPLRNFGFSVDEAAAMLGKWQKEGVNTELVMGSLRIASGKFADKGIDLRQGLAGAVDAIKAAGSASEATAIAMDIFGARAGADMADTIRGGKFAIDEYVAGLQNSEGALKKAAGESATLGGQFKLMGNAAKAGLAPLTDAVFDIATKLVQQAVPAVQAFWSQIGDKLAPLALKAKDALIPLIQQIGPVLSSVMDTVLPKVSAFGMVLGTAFVFAWDLISPIIGLIRDSVSSLGSLLGSIDLSSALSSVQSALADTGALFTSWGASIASSVDSLVSGVTTKATALWDQLTGLWQAGVDGVLGAAQGLWDGLITSWENIRVGVSGAAQGLLSWLGEAWSGGVAYLQGLVLTLAEGFRSAWTWISTTVSGLVGRLVNWLQSSWGRAGTWLGGLLTRLANMFAQAWSWIRTTVGGVVGKLVNAALSAFRWLGQKAAGVWERMQDLFQSAWSGIIGIFRSAAGGIIRGLGNMFSKMAELAGKGLKAVGSAVYRIFTAILDKIKALLAGLGLGDIFASLMPDADGGGAGWLDGIANNVMNAARSVMSGIGDVMSFFEAKWDRAKAKLSGFFDQSEQLQAEADSQATYNGGGTGLGPAADISGLGGGGSSGGGPKSHTAPDGMSGREADGSEWYIDPNTGKKIYTSGPKKNQQDAKERGAEAKAAAAAAKKGQKKGAAGSGGEDDPAVSAAKTAADTAKRISEALQAAAETLRELGRTELPGESVWGPKIAAIETFIQASMTSFDRLAVGLLEKIGQTEDGADLLATAKAKAITAVSSLTGGMVDTMTKVQGFLTGLVKAKWPDQAQIDTAFLHIGAALTRVRDQAISLASVVGVGSGKEGEKTPAEHLTAVGQALAGWVESFVKTTGLLDVLATVKTPPPAALAVVETTLRRVGEIMAGFLKGPDYDLTTDAEKTAADLEVSRDIQATLSGGVDLLTKVAAAAEQLARVKPVPDAAWQNVRSIMAAAAVALYALVAGEVDGRSYDNTKDPEKTAIIQTVSRDVATTLSGGVDLLAKVSAAGRQLAKTPPVPEAAWQNVRGIMDQAARMLGELGAPLLKDTERSTKDLAVVQVMVQTLGSSVTLVGQVSALALQMQKAVAIPPGALDQVKASLLTLSQMLGALLVDPGGKYDLLKDAERTVADLGLAGSMLQTLSQTLGVVAQTVSLGDMLQRGRPFDPSLAEQALRNARAALTAVQAYAAGYAAELQQATVFAEDRLAEVQQYGAALREAIGVLEGAGKLKLGNVLPIDPANVNQAIANADLAWQRLFAWSTFLASSMENQGRDVLEALEQAKVYGAALRDALSVLDAAAKLKLGEVLPWTAQDVNQAIANADLAWQRLFSWASFLEASMLNQGRDVLLVMEQAKVYGAALKDALSVLEAAGKFSLSGVLPVDPADVTTAIQNADQTLRLVADWARSWHEALATSRRDVETVLAEMGTYGTAIKNALDLVGASVGLSFAEVLPIDEANVRAALANADFVLGLVEEFAANWRTRVDILQGSLDKDRLAAEAAEIDQYTRSAGAALDLIGKSVALVVDTVPPIDRGMVQAALAKVRLVLDEVAAAAASWASAIQASGRRLADVSGEAEAFTKAAGGAFDLMLKVKDFVDKVTAPTILQPLERGAKSIPAQAIEATVTRLRDTMKLIMDQLVGLYGDIAGSSALPKVEQLTSVVAPAVDALTKVLDLLSLDRLMKSPLVDLKLRGAFASKAAQTRMEQMKRQIVEGVQRTVAALVEALQGIKIPADIGGSGIERLAALYDHLAAILERIAAIQMPDAAKLDAFLAAGQKLVTQAPSGGGGGGLGPLAVAQVAASGAVGTLKPPEHRITINNAYNQYGDNNFFDEKATKLMLERLGSFGVRTR